MPVSLEDPDRLRALALSGLMGSEPEVEFDWITRLVSRLLEAPVSMITLVDDQRQFFKSSVGLAVRETPLEHSFCQHVVRDQGPLILGDARSDPRTMENRALRNLGLIAYLGVPLTTS
jgi:GAF domain-containing protein